MLFVYNEGLFWLGESCRTYIILELHSYVSLKRRTKKLRKNGLYHDHSLSKQPPQLPLHNSLQLTLNLSDLLSFFHPLLPHTSHFSLLHSERPIWGSVRIVCVPVWVWLELLHISVSLNPCPSSPLFLWLWLRHIGKATPGSLSTWYIVEETGAVQFFWIP